MDFYRTLAKSDDPRERQRGQAVLDAAPPLGEELPALGYLAFAHLATERQVGMGAGPIPWSKVQEWARDRGVDQPDGRDDLLAVVTHLDTIWLKHQVEKVKKTPKPGTGGMPPPR